MKPQTLYNAKDVITKNGGPLPISLSCVYAGIRNGSIPSVTIGTRKLIPSWYIEELLNKKSIA
ncbi:MAG: hypothetical protein J6B49_02845 [Phascolarctobacterium sp.]|nr:hypothetical protein [Phascolarctobacterium sp.]